MPYRRHELFNALTTVHTVHNLSKTPNQSISQDVSQTIKSCTSPESQYQSLNASEFGRGSIDDYCQALNSWERTLASMTTSKELSPITKFYMKDERQRSTNSFLRIEDYCGKITWLNASLPITNLSVTTHAKALKSDRGILSLNAMS